MNIKIKKSKKKVLRNNKKQKLTSFLLSFLIIFQTITGIFLPVNIFLISPRLSVQETQAAVVTWDNGGGDGLWSTATNWSGDILPQAGDAVVFDGTSNTACSANSTDIINNLGSVSLNSGYTSTLTLISVSADQITLTGDLTVNSGIVLCQGDTTTDSIVGADPYQGIDVNDGAGIIINAANVTVAEGASISADEQGFPADLGPGGGVNMGGAYGGYGAKAGSYNLNIYGSVTQPISLGSGGDDYAGGGAVKLNIAGTLAVNGNISANGGGGSEGGSGGSVWLIMETLAGSGTIAANGGDVNGSRSASGGRVAVEYTTTTYTGTFSVREAAASSIAGQPGTFIYPDQATTDLTINDGTIASTPTNLSVSSMSLVSGTYTIPNITVTNNATLWCQGDTSTDSIAGVDPFRGIEVNDGTGVIINATSITIDTGAAISANGQGFLIDNGPGNGGDTQGGAYGGYGGNNNLNIYGSVTQPTSLGSGSDTFTGGGAIKLNITETLTVNGAISANGGGGYEEGGSGGSVWLITDILAGSGAITADGGDVGGSVRSGGGGRVAVEHATTTYTGIFSVIEGTNGGSPGQPGTFIYPDQATTDLTINDGTIASTPTNLSVSSMSLVSGTYTIPNITVTNNATLWCQGDTSTDSIAGVDPFQGIEVNDGTGVTINATSITIDVGASISANSQGFPVGSGPGIGGGTQGAAYGGNGGNNNLNIYGSVTQPTSLGSGSYNYAGGGAIKLNITETLTINGAISANGGGGYEEGGSGGSVWLITDILAGSGAITADGGDVGGSIRSGGGGRVAVEYITTSYIGTFSVREGTGTTSLGEPGTSVVTPIPGYTADNIIPAAQCTQSTAGDGIVTIGFKIKDPGDEINGTTYNTNHTLKTFQYSIDGGSTWATPANADASTSLSVGWTNNSGSNYIGASIFASATAYSFTWNTKHADLTGLNNVSQNDVQIRFTVKDTVTQSAIEYTLDSQSPATSESFTVDNVPPIITNITSDKINGSYKVGEVIDIDLTFSESVTTTGNATVTLDTTQTCVFAVSNSTTATCDYIVQAGDTTSDLNVSSVSGTIADQAGNAMTNFTPTTNLSTNKDIIIDTTAPTLSEITPVTTPAADTTPNYTFNSDEAGDITCGGSCLGFSTVTAALGNNTVTFNALTNNTYADCTITVTDTAGNASGVLNITSFTISSAGITITESASSTDIKEGSTTDTYTIVLDTTPTNDVVVTITSDTQSTTDSAVLTFTSANWNTLRTITITATDDTDIEGDHTSTITHTSASGDTNYNSISISSITANITDNDFAGGGGLPSGFLNPPTEPEPSSGNPEGGFKVIINNGNQKTNNGTVNLKFFVGVNITKMAISNTPDFKNASIIPYQEEIEWKLPSKNSPNPLSQRESTCVVYAKFYTRYGVASEVIEVEINDPGSLIAGSNDFQEGDIITGPDGIKVYVVKPSTDLDQTSYKRHILNPNIFGMYLHLKWENIKQVSQETLKSFQTSSLYCSIDSYRTYLLEEIGEVKGIKHYLDLTPQEFEDKGYSWDEVFIINKEERDWYEMGEEIE